MADEDKTFRTRTQLETDKQRAITWREYGYTSVIWAAAILCLTLAIGTVLMLIYLIPAVKAWQRSSIATAQTYETSLSRINELIDKASTPLLEGTQAFKQGMENARDTTAELKKTVEEVRVDYLPVTFKQLQQSTANLNGIVTDLRTGTLPLVNENLSSLNDNQLQLGQTLTTTREGLKSILTDLSATGHNIRVISEDPSLLELPREINTFTKSLNKSAGNIEVVTANGIEGTNKINSILGSFDTMAKDVQVKSHSLLFPPPAPWWRRYLLQPLMQVGGATYLVVKIANGLNN